MYKWHLEKENHKFTCPHCGEKKRFKRYVYEHNGEYIDETVGMCDRINTCGYHLTPKQFFASRGIDANSVLPKGYNNLKNNTSYQVKKKEEAKIFTIDNKWITKALSNETSFVKFLETKFSEKQINEIQRLYFLGEVDNCDGKEKDVIFWQVDSLLRVRAGKIMKYDKTTGKRLHSQYGINWVHNIKVVKEELLEDWKMTQCLFGEHLLAIYPQKPICLVESEKAAIIASVYFPQYNWLATGGASQFSKERCQSLKGKMIELFPDLGMFEKWKIKASEIENELNCKFHLNTFLEESATPEQREQGLDIADILLDKKIEINELITT
jgi:hypothetical protein